MKPNPLTKACAAAAVATSWGIGEDAQAFGVAVEPVSVEISLNSETRIDNLYFLYAANSSSLSASEVNVVPLGSRGPGSFRQNVELDSSFEPRFEGFSYTFLGIYSDPSNPDPDERSGISITIDNSRIDGRFGAVGQTFDEFFFRFGEASLITNLENGNTAELQSFFAIANFDLPNSFDDITEEVLGGTQINFTVGDISGTANAGPIPEPSSLTLLGSMAGLLVLRRRR